IACEFEKVLNYLNAKDYILDEDKSKKRTDQIKELIKEIKKGLFQVCDIKGRSGKLPDEYKEHNEDKYYFHKKFLKALLQRPLNLRRANIFTINYDLAFEYAFDELGIHYIDGFAGFHKRCFRPETFEYDLFYPGSTTS